MSLVIHHIGGFGQVEVNFFSDRFGLDRFAKIRWTCPWCQEAKEWDTTDDDCLEQLALWIEGTGEGIQDVMPSIPSGIREAFISGICPECWDRAFRDVDGWNGAADESKDLPF